MSNLPNATAHLSLVHRTQVPPGDGPHPTLIALHGRGSDEADLLGLAPYLDERLLWISPRAPLELEGGFEWYRLPAVGAPDQATFEAALAALDRFIGECRQAYPIDPQRLFLLGFSQGGMMAYTHTLTRPGQITGMVGHSSYIPLKSIEAAADIDRPGLAGKPFAVIHGTKDPMIPIRWAREARDFLTRVDADVTYHELPMAHNVSDRSLAAVDQWMQKQLQEES